MLLFLTFSLSLYALDSEPVIVHTTYGKIKGRDEVFLGNKRIQSFLGVPFAQPPTGKLRFKPPKVPKRWNGTIDTLKPARYI